MNTDVEIYKLLLDIDSSEPIIYDEPPDFDWRLKVASVAAVKPILEKELCLTFELDYNSSQDSYFAAELVSYADLEGRTFEASRINPTYTLRFSNFGDLVTGWSAVLPEKKSHELEAKFEPILAKHSFVYVPASWLLSHVYDGTTSSLQARNESWWERFFGYI